jgi:hemerythrin
MSGATIAEVVSLSSSSDSLFGVSQQLAEGAEAMTAVLTELVDYTKQHFGAEIPWSSWI